MNYKIKTKTFWVSDMTAPFEVERMTSPSAAHRVIREIWPQLNLDSNQEHMVVFGINAKGKLIGYKVISSGTETATLVSPSMLFRAALLLGAHSIIMVHNHPSGDPDPSREDKELTKRCRSTGEVIGVPLADHLILGEDNRFHTFRVSEGWDR